MRNRPGPSRNRFYLWLGLSVWALPGPLCAQVEPVIRHQALECLPNNQFPQLEAVIEPGSGVQTAKVYFRAEAYPDFYYVPMRHPETAPSADLFRAILPKPSPETTRVLYYIEAVNQAYHSARTAESASEVASDADCKRRDPAAAFFTGNNPGIVVGAIRMGLPSVPPGFQAAGIASFISAAGMASSTGGGIGAGTGVLVGAGAAAAVGGAVAAGGGGGGGTTTTTVAPAAPTTSTTTTTVAPTTTTSVPPFNEAPRACFTFTPDPPVITEGGSVTFDASCSVGDRTLREDNVASYEWDFGDGETGRGRRVTHTYSRAGFYVCKLTVTDQAGRQDTARINVHVESNVKACFTVVNPSSDLSCKVTFDATCSTGNITRYDWVFDTTGILGGPFAFPNAAPVFLQDFPPCPSFPFPSSHQLTVYAGSFVSTTSQTFIVAYLGGPREDSRQTWFASFLDLRSEGPPPWAHLMVNGAEIGTAEPAAALQHPLDGQPGENTIEGYLGSGEVTEGTWRFDFSATERFTPGSIRVESGESLSLDATSVVFRLGGGAAERVRFSFQLSP